MLGKDTEFFLAKNPDEALKIIKEENTSDRNGEGIQIAFLDIEMSHVSGLELTRKIQLFVAENGKYAYEAIKLYVRCFIPKPVNEDKIRNAVENLRYPLD